MYLCKAIRCSNQVTDPTQDFCPDCQHTQYHETGEPTFYQRKVVDSSPLASKYPQHFKSVEHLAEVDVYAIHHIFEINDPSGAIQEASRKLLLSGSHTGKPAYQNILEARDILTRWLELNTTPH